MPRANMNSVFEYKIPIPTIDEQQRIVSILDSTLRELAESKEQAKNYLIQTKALFQTEIDKKILNIGPIYDTKKLGILSEIKYGYTESASQEMNGPKYLRITDIQNNNVNWDTVPYCCIDNTTINKYLLKDNDIVFARTGATTGKCFLVTSPPQAVFASYLIRLRIKDKFLNPNFLMYFFKTSLYWKLINIGISGAAQGGFNASKLSEILLKFPSIEKQNYLISYLDELSEYIEKLEAVYNRQIALHDELKQSILHQAFNGNL
jgi:type I restriction enzyme S subunit